MKTQLISLLLLLSSITIINAQEKLVTRSAKVSFISSTPVEEFEAVNSQAASILTTSDNKVAFNVILKSFKFEKALMEEHFNEKYVHSDKYPAAKFKGSIPASVSLTTPKAYKGVEIAGEMILHGVTKPIKIMADIVVKDDNTVEFDSTFNLTLADYNVEIPSLVKEKISKDVKVTVDAHYK